MVVAIVVGRDGVNTLLVASQVVLSIVLPFVVFPLIWLTSSKSIMSVKKPRSPRPTPAEPLPVLPSTSSDDEDKDASPAITQDSEAAADEIIDFSNGKFITALGYIIWVIIIVANGYAIVTLILGKGS